MMLKIQLNIVGGKELKQDESYFTMEKVMESL